MSHFATLLTLGYSFKKKSHEPKQKMETYSFRAHKRKRIKSVIS